MNPNVYVLTDLSFQEKTIDNLRSIENIPSIFIDDSFEICGLSSEIQKYLSNKMQFKSLCRKSKNVPFSEDLENKVIVSKNRIEKALLKF